LRLAAEDRHEMPSILERQEPEFFIVNRIGPKAKPGEMTIHG
jgi:hypothetical protein